MLTKTEGDWENDGLLEAEEIMNFGSPKTRIMSARVDLPIVNRDRLPAAIPGYFA